MQCVRSGVENLSRGMMNKITNKDYIICERVFLGPLLRTINESLTLFKILRVIFSVPPRTHLPTSHQPYMAKKHGISQSSLTNRKENPLYLRDFSKLSLIIVRWVNTTMSTWSCTVAHSHAFICICSTFGLVQFNLQNGLGNENRPKLLLPQSKKDLHLAVAYWEIIKRPSVISKEL